MRPVSRQTTESLQNIRLDMHSGLLRLVQRCVKVGEKSSLVGEEEHAEATPDGDGEGRRALAGGEVVEDDFEAGISSGPGKDFTFTASEVPGGNSWLNCSGSDMFVAGAGQPLFRGVIVWACFNFRCDSRRNNQHVQELR